MVKKSFEISIQKMMHLGIDFWKDFGGFWKENGGMLAPKSNPKLIPTWKIDFLKNRRFSLGKTMILKVQGTEVGSKNQSKIHEKMKSRWEGVLGSVFHRFWWVWKAKLAGQTELGEGQNTPWQAKEGLNKTRGQDRQVKSCQVWRGEIQASLGHPGLEREGFTLP